MNLSQNEIRSIPPLQHFKYLAAIDLSFNNIKTVKSLEPLKVLAKSLININLHGNPVCAVFFTAQQYVQCLIEILPNLTTIDSQSVNAKEFVKNDFFSAKRNYLCSLDGYDLVEFFIETFFTTWNNESDKMKSIVESFYQKNASLTFSFSFNESILKTARYEINIRKNRLLSRNLSALTGKDMIYFGHNRICSFYRDFYNTIVIFDIPTFSIDLAVFNVSRFFVLKTF